MEEEYKVLCLRCNTLTVKSFGTLVWWDHLTVGSYFNVPVLLFEKRCDCGRLNIGMNSDCEHFNKSTELVLSDFVKKLREYGKV